MPRDKFTGIYYKIPFGLFSAFLSVNDAAERQFALWTSQSFASRGGKLSLAL